MSDDTLLATINALDGWARQMGLVVTVASADEVVAHFDVAPQHLQAYGIVHGGVHCGIIEAACSTGAAIAALQHNRTVVGLENSTSFIHAARGGTLKVTATPVTRGRRTQVWQGSVTDADGRVLATGRVRLLCLEAGADLAGKPSGHA